MRRTTAALATIALVAAACGDDDGGGGQAQTEEGAIEAVESATGGALRGNAGAVLNFLNEECRDATDPDDVRLAVGLIPAFFGDLFEDFDIDDIEVEAGIVEFEGDRARVDVSYLGPDGSNIDSIGFSSDTITVMYEDGKWVDTGCDFEDTTEADAERLEEALAELGYEGTRDDPIPRSVAAPVGRGFVVSVDAVDTDARAALEAIEDAFISEPEAGEQFVLVSVTVGFDGDDEPQGLLNLNAQIIGGSSSLGIDNFGCGSFPTQLTSRSVSLFKGGVTNGDMCFLVPGEDVDGMLLSLNGSFGSDRQVIFDPTVEADTPVAVTGSSGPAPGGALTDARENPRPLGEPVNIGEGWTITVRGIEDATAQLLADNEFLDPPPTGFVFALLEYELAYDGDDQSASGFSVDVDLVGDSNVSADRNCNIFEIPGELDRFADVFQGGTLSGVSCFVVDERDFDSLVVVASADFFDDEPFVLAVR